MRILVTGANGFLGKTLCDLLCEKHSIITLDLFNANIYCDISNSLPSITEQFDLILHAAGKAHFIPKTEEEKQVFFDVNYNGTVNLCTALEKSGLPKYFIFVSTVAVYGEEFGEMITEEHPLNGNTPYALSKIQAENFLIDWCEKHNIVLTILRPSLIAGPNPPGNLGQMIKGINTGRYLSIGGGKARKSVLMVNDIANLVPLVAAKGGIYNVCDSHYPTFRELENTISKQLGKKYPRNIPLFFAKFLSLIGNFIGDKAPINSNKLKKITTSLTFSNEKIVREIGWKPLNVLDYFKIN